MKKVNRTKIKKQLDKLVKDYVKIRDDYTCQHCGKPVEGSNCHASHVIPVGSHSDMQFDPMNIKVLCYHCHINWWHKNPLEADEWFKKAFPDRWKYLKKRSQENIKIPTIELEEMVEKYKKLIKEG